MNISRSVLVALLSTVPISAFSADNTFDLNTLLIERTPRIAYDANTKYGGWPSPGATVQWVAHVKNWGGQVVPSAGYRWILDGEVVATGTIENWEAGATVKVSWPWTWEKVRHSLRFEVDPDNALTGEFSEQNNAVTIDTDAVTVGFWIEKSLADYFHANQYIYLDGANSFEDYAQRQIRTWNAMNELARFESSPNGIVDRIRLDQVIHVPDDALPLNGGLATNNPDRLDKTVDLMWGFPWDPNSVGPGKFYDPVPNSPFHYEFGLIHELNHARYLIDSYGFDVHDQAVENITDPNGVIMHKTPAMPQQWNWMPHLSKYPGLMASGGNRRYSEHEAYQWNRIAGQRARQGNMNSPGDIGVFLNTDLPERNHLQFVDQNGMPVAGAQIAVRQAGNYNEWYGKLYPQTPQISAVTDANGFVTLPKNMFGDWIRHTYGIANSVLFLAATKNGVTRTAFMEASDVGIQYWRGQVQDAYYEVRLNFASTNDLPGEIALGPRGFVRGRVVDTSGVPVSNAWVGPHPDGENYARTDAAGQFSLSLPSGKEYKIAAHKSDSGTTVYPLSNRVTVTPGTEAILVGDLVLPAAVPNLVPTTTRSTTIPVSTPYYAVNSTSNTLLNLSDNSFLTRWSTVDLPPMFVLPESPLTVQLFLRADKTMNQIVLHWQSSQPRSYAVQVSQDGTNYSEVYRTDFATGGYHIPLTQTDFRAVNVIRFPTVVARYIRVVIYYQGQMGYSTSLWEVQAALVPTAVSLADAARALQLSSGLDTASTADMARLNLVDTGDSAGRIDVSDATAIARIASGL